MGTRSSVRPQFRHSIGWGLAAFLVGYGVTVLWKGTYAASIAADAVVRFSATGMSTWAGDVQLAALLADTGVAETTWSGWLFYNAHFVPISAGNFPNTVPAFVPNLLLVAAKLSYLLLFLVPPFTLTLAGLGVARDTPPGMTTISTSLRVRLSASVVRGMSITMGYLPGVLVGAVVFSVNPVDERAALLAPEFLSSVLVAGVLYPIVFGGLGGRLSRLRA